MIRKWFHDVRSDYNDFIKALLSDDVRMMNTYMNKNNTGNVQLF